MIRISVLYPNEGGSFDVEYYLSKHRDLVHKLLTPYGLVRMEVDKGLGSAGPGEKAPFVAIGHLYFNTLEDLQEGMKAHDPDLGADLVNFTDISPIFQVSEIL